MADFDLRLALSWRCRRTSPPRRRGQTRSSGRWTKIWMENSPLKNSLRSHLPSPSSSQPAIQYLKFFPGCKEWSLNCAAAPVWPPGFLDHSSANNHIFRMDQKFLMLIYIKSGSRISPFLKTHILLFSKQPSDMNWTSEHSWFYTGFSGIIFWRIILGTFSSYFNVSIAYIFRFLDIINSMHN